MAEFPAMPLWTDAYLADTRHLSTVEHGAYLLLLMEAWRRPSCSLPDDDRVLARLAGVGLDEWAEIKATVLEFWTLDGRSKTWHQKRQKKERSFVASKSTVQRDKALKRWNKTKNNDATAMPERCPSDAPTPTPTVKKEEPKGSSQKAASRLPDDWRLPPSWGEWAASEGMDELTIRREAEKFADYWRGVAGAKGRKLDWLATWRNWVRKALDDRRTGFRAGQPKLGETRVTATGVRQEFIGGTEGWVRVHE